MGTPSLVMLMVRCCAGVEGFQVKISCQNSCATEEGFCRDSHIAILYLALFKVTCSHSLKLLKICVSLKLFRLNSNVIIQISVFTYQKLHGYYSYSQLCSKALEPAIHPTVWSLCMPMEGFVQGEHLPSLTNSHPIKF